MSIDWHKLRTWDGSQQTAFEELCCQLAAYEQAPSGSKFIRKGTPDAGVECYWRFPNKDERAWQAKFFLSSPDKNQWTDLDESVKKALQKHPHLTVYTICLPLDRSDPRIEEQSSFMDKWNAHVEKWKGWAAKENRSIEFSYWGTHEIFVRLSHEQHKGRLFFWFKRELFSEQWYRNQVHVAIADAEPRYTPELNVELPIARLFEGLGRTPTFQFSLRNQYGKLRRTFANTNWAEDVGTSGENAANRVRENISQMLEALEDTCKGDFNITQIPFGSLSDLASKAEGVAWEVRMARHDQVALLELSRELSTINRFFQSNEARLANIPALLLVGDAGTGKTHLFCDVARQRLGSGHPTILLHGVHFRDDEPWSQIIRMLGLSCTRDELLEALEANAQAKGVRALILIDALNVGEGKYLWKNRLGGILTTLSQYPWIGIALSVRSTYESMIVPDNLVPERLVRETHNGFAGYEYQAAKAFFQYFQIELPGVPLLNPEFQNPLFLTLFCRAIHNSGFTKVPSGIRGITAIFDFFLDSVNQKLSGTLDFDIKSKLIQHVVKRLTEVMSDRGQTWLPRPEVLNIVNALLPSDGYEKSLFRHLISEGVLAEERFFEGDNLVDGIHFAYDRFTDYLVAGHLLDKHLNKNDPATSFTLNSPLDMVLRSQGKYGQHNGLIEAFSVQVPERIGMELAEVAPDHADSPTLLEAFIKSIIWRDTQAFTNGTQRYIRKLMASSQHYVHQTLDAHLTVALNPEHPYNANFLHQWLMKDGLAERDAWWSIFLHEQYQDEEQGAVHRLIDWAWSSEDKGYISNEAIGLCSKVLAWFLTSSNRYLRDRATKALIALLTPRLDIVKSLLHDFLDVNDLYVLERLLAVAYGCAMRSRDNVMLRELAQNIYGWIFEAGTPLPHILLRDYARGVIELALHRGLELSLDREKVRPPYRSTWPSNIPSEDELRHYGEWREDMPQRELARTEIYHSVMDWGDFSRYIIGTNSDNFEWSSRPLGEPKQPSPRDMLRDFGLSLTSKQSEAWNMYLLLRQKGYAYILLDVAEKDAVLEQKIDDNTVRILVSEAEHIFTKTLGKKKLRLFQDLILPSLNDSRLDVDEYAFDLSIAQRWILQRVFELGWTIERFGSFDRFVNYNTNFREANKPERIGKKYQWLAYHEFLARVSDNFEYTGDRWSDEEESYEGPWQLHICDIDPSSTIRKTAYERSKPTPNSWWFPSTYSNWNEGSDDEWLRASEDLPAVEPLIEVTNPKDNSKWLVLEAFYEWEPPTPPEQERLELPRRQMWYMIKSYITKKPAIQELYEWAKEQDFMGRWMPESAQIYSSYLGEFYWAPSFEHHEELYSQYQWNTDDSGEEKRIPKELIVTTTQYLWEHSSFDCSIDDSIVIHLPSKWLVDQMHLEWNGSEGEFFDRYGNLIAFDPSVRVRGPRALLVNRDALIKYLDANGYGILWTLLAEKNIFGLNTVPENWKGRLDISGAYRINETKIEGARNARFRSRRSKET